MDDDTIRYIVERIHEYAEESKSEYLKNTNDEFLSGKFLAYQEAMDTLVSEFTAHGLDLRDMEM